MARLKILTDTELHKFERPEILPVKIKSLCFAIDKPLLSKINQLRTTTNKVYFVLAYGYFKTFKRFFNIENFRKDDLLYVARLLRIKANTVKANRYNKKTKADHQQDILELLKQKPYDPKVNQWLAQEIKRRVTHLSDPRQLFFEAVQLLVAQNIEVPSYHRLAELITKCYLTYESLLIKIVQEHITKAQQEALENILTIDPENSSGLFDAYKNIDQSLKANAINASVEIFKGISELFVEFLPLIEKLALTPNASEYYAVWVKKAKLSQIKQIPQVNKKYLLLIAYIKHQYYLRQDHFVDLLLKSVQTIKNSGQKALDKKDKLSRGERRKAVQHLTITNRDNKELIEEITNIIRDPGLSAEERIFCVDHMLIEHEEQITQVANDKLAVFEQSLENMITDKDNFDILEKLSLKLQRRVAGIIKVLCFNAARSDKQLLAVVNYFAARDGNITSKAPIKFLKSDEQEALTTDAGIFRISLYKVLLFINVADAIKSGELNLKYSYRYLAIQDYLISDELWHSQKNSLLKSCGLEKYTDCETILEELKQKLNQQYDTTNMNFLEGKNEFLKFNKKGKVQIATPALADKETEQISELLKQNGDVPLLKILTDINNVTKFTKKFKHHSVKNIKSKPDVNTFLAGIIGLGCNIGITRMARISTGINEHTLHNTVNWHFSLKNLGNVNQCIVAFIKKLSLSESFINDQEESHSSSDGCKVNVGVDSVLSSYSFKFFGKDKGVNVYTFIDERHTLFYSTVFSASEREAAYVIDGLIHNEVNKTEIHSTDTHGYTETIFYAAYFIRTAFAPRIKNIGDQSIYSFISKKIYQNKGYEILPSRTISKKIIMNNWDDLLRFMVTIKLKEVTASQLFKRLSSYAKDNPLYKAQKEFGRIIKSIYILTFLDDVKIRQRVTKLLNLIESSNKFFHAIFYANNSEFKVGTKEEQEIAMACKALIQNSIVLWNYLYLSQLLADCADDNEREEMCTKIKQGSILSWEYVNFHGEFNFKRKITEDIPFDLKKIMALKL